MKKKPLIVFLLLGVFVSASAQDRIPSRGISGSGSFGPPRINVKPGETKSVQKVVKQITYMSISPQRQWKSSDGKSIFASLLTFNADGKTSEELKSLPLEVIKEGKVRLLKDSKPFVLPLDKLSEEDQKYVKGVAESAAKRKVDAGEKKADDSAEKKAEEDKKSE